MISLRETPWRAKPPSPRPERTPFHRDILTGTQPDGTASDLTCLNWTSTEGRTLVGHFDRTGQGSDGESWNSAHETESCSREGLGKDGGDSLFYCFAID